jgi:hypothetical protein
MRTAFSGARLLAVAVALASPIAAADVVTEWDRVACDIVGAVKVPTPLGVRTIAVTQTAVYEAANRITGRYPGVGREKAPNASVEAAVAAANRAALSRLVPEQQAAIEAAYRKAIDAIPEGDARSAGIAIGERAAADVIARRAEDGSSASESYRPVTSAGAYVPTTIPAASQWPRRKPWLMSSPDQFRPGPPPDLGSSVWVRDFNEVKSLGARNGSTRTEEQTEIARFWEATMPAIYHGVIRSVADQPERDITRNARLLAAVAQGMDDALTAVFDAKYHYNFWRPVTAIRNGDIDGSDRTERDASWLPFIDTPMHPEYPCAHCILSATVGTILQAEAEGQPMPELSTTSHTLPGVTRRWKTTDDFIREVGNGRIYDGVHYRNSAEVGAAMGRQIGELAAKRFFATPAPGQ